MNIQRGYRVFVPAWRSSAHDSTFRRFQDASGQAHELMRGGRFANVVRFVEAFEDRGSGVRMISQHTTVLELKPPF